MRNLTIHRRQVAPVAVAAATLLIPFPGSGRPAVAEDLEPPMVSPLEPVLTKGAAAQGGLWLRYTDDLPDTLEASSRIVLKDFPLTADRAVTLDLRRFLVATPDIRVVAGTPDGDQPIAPPDIMLFRGTVAGLPGSRAVVGISPRGLYALVETGDDRFALGPVRRGAVAPPGADFLVLPASARTEPETEVCGTSCFPDDSPLPALRDMTPALPGSFQVCRLAIECDYEFYDAFGNYDDALDYVYMLFADIGDIYERDVSTKLALTWIRLWTTINDPYSDKVPGDPADKHLNEFRDYFIQYHSTPGTPGFVERDLAHQLSAKGVTAMAWEGVLCSFSLGYSISGGNAGGATIPDSLFHDIRYAAHEIGHNFNGHHTHCFDPPIDKCGVEPGCNQTVDCSTAPSSLMSYCHNCPGGQNNILLYFHSLNITRMRSHITSSCLRVARDPCYVDWRNTSGTEDGTAGSPYNTVKEGVEGVLPGGTVRIADGTYSESSLTVWQPMVLAADGGSAIVGE